MFGSTVMAKAAAAGVVAAAAVIASAGTACADPDAPPPAPAPSAPGSIPMPGAQSDELNAKAAEVLGPTPLAGAPVPVMGGTSLGPEGINLLAQRGADPSAPTGLLGVPLGVPGLTHDTVLGQNSVPSAPGAGPGTVPHLSVFNNQYGMAQCLVPSAPGQCHQFDVEPGQENADITPHDWLHRYIDMYHDGRLRGGSLSQWNQQQLGEPLPGTAPPPGTNIPPGLGQYYEPPEPAAAPPPPGAAVAPPAPPAP